MCVRCRWCTTRPCWIAQFAKDTHGLLRVVYMRGICTHTHTRCRCRLLPLLILLLSSPLSSNSHSLRKYWHNWILCVCSHLCSGEWWHRSESSTPHIAHTSMCTANKKPVIQPLHTIGIRSTAFHILTPAPTFNLMIQIFAVTWRNVYTASIIIFIPTHMTMFICHAIFKHFRFSIWCGNARWIHITQMTQHQITSD